MHSIPSRRSGEAAVYTRKMLRSAVVGVIALSATAAYGATWNQTAGGSYDWNSDENWTAPVTFPDGAGAVANISADFADSLTINLNQAIKVGSLTINDTGATGDSGVTIAPGTGGSLEFETISGNATLTFTSAGNIISAPITFTSPTTITANATGSLSGNLSGSATITKTGSAQLNLNGDNSGYTGKWALTGGTSGSALNVGSSDIRLGAVPASAVADFIRVTGSSTLLFDGITIHANRGITIDATRRLYLRTGSTTGSARIAGNITGAGELQMNGSSSSSIIVLSGNNDYTGDTRIAQGILRAGSTSAFGNQSAVLLAQTTTNNVRLDLNGFNNTIGSLASTQSGTGTITVTLGTATLTTGTNNTSTDFGGVISGTGGLIKTGTGTQTLSGVNLYTGDTVVNGGTLSVTGSLAGTAVTVNSSATLAGTGTLAGPVTVNAGGTLSPGLSPGIVTLGSNLTLGGDYLWEFDNEGAIGEAGINFDQVVLTGDSATVDLAGGTLKVSLLSGDYTSSFWENAQSWKIIDVANGDNANYLVSGITSTASFASYGAFSTRLGTGEDAGDVFLDWTPAAVPEPAAVGFLAMGLMGIAGRRRKSV